MYMTLWAKNGKTPNRIWDVEPDGSVKPLQRSRLESDAFRMKDAGVPTVISKMGTSGAVATYAFVGSLLALLWGSSGVIGFLSNVLFWPIILGFKVISSLFWPAVLLGGAVGGAWWWFKGRNGSPKKSD
jgi:hypothetical protein